MKLLMCRPDFYGVEYEINPWMDIKKQVNHSTALQQWDSLYELLKKCGANIELVEPVAGWPDMTFTANAGLLYRHKIILAQFKYKERQGEVPYFKKWFMQAGFQVLSQPSLFFEGAGDALLVGDTLFAGYGFRTQRNFYDNIPEIDQRKIVYCELVNPYFYHLDTCFCPLDDKSAIWYPAAFSQESQKNMAEQVELIPVNNNEADRFACNAVVMDNHIVLPTGCPEITGKLENRGFILHACDMSEFMKSGGACKCLTLRLDQT